MPEYRIKAEYAYTPIRFTYLEYLDIAIPIDLFNWTKFYLIIWIKHSSLKFKPRHHFYDFMIEGKRNRPNYSRMV